MYTKTCLSDRTERLILFCYVLFQKTPVTSFPAPRDSALKITCESPIELPENQDEKEVFVLKKLYEHDSFRDGQLEAIRSILQCNDTLVLIPTGGGKSVIYTGCCPHTRIVCYYRTSKIYHGRAGRETKS